MRLKAAIILALGAFLLLAFPALAAKNCSGPFKGINLSAKDLAETLASHQAWVFSHFEKLMGRKQPPSGARANLCGAGIGKAVLDKADLSEALLSEANMNGASLKGAFLAGADLSFAGLASAGLEGSVLRMANFGGADLSHADLSGADLGGANFAKASLRGANLSGAVLFDSESRRKTDLSANLLLGAEIGQAVMAVPNFEGADLDSVLFEPKSGKLPLNSNIHLAINLQGMTFAKSPGALLELRETFRKASLRGQERQITYAIRHAKRLAAPPLRRIVEYAAFEAPVAFGMKPWRALLIVISLVFVFFLIYATALIAPQRGAFVREGKPMVYNGKRSLALPLYYSLFSVIQVNWGGPEICRHALTLPGLEPGLSAAGWLRKAARVQSSMTLYLIALFLLCLFGRPFG